MAKTSTYHVRNNRIHFKCPDCKAKRSYAVAPHARRKRITCHNCGAHVNCQLNRRSVPRESQAGRALLVTMDNREFDIDLNDISPIGVGFTMPLSLSRLIRVRQIVEFKCLWNPRLFHSGRYRIANIYGQRAGAKVMAVVAT